MAALVPVALLWLQLQFGALRVLERLPGLWGDVSLAVVWVASAVLLWRLLRGELRLPWRVLGTRWPSVVLVVLVAVCAAFVYPEVDGRRSTGGGSDADDAVVLVVENVRGGEDPYGDDTYLGNPPTTGPGSVLWALPFPGRRAYALGVVVALAGTLWALRRWTGSWRVPSVTALLVGGSVPFWEGVAQGSDHLVLACGLALVVNGVQQQDRTVRFLHTICSGVLATWRAAYVHLPVLLAISRWRDDRRAALLLGVGGTALAVALHLLFLRWTDGGWDAYDPVQQLLTKSDEDLNAAGRAVLLLVTVAAGVVVLAEAASPRPRADVLVLAGIGAPLAAIAIVGAFTAPDPAGWSEASYLLPTLVLASVVAARAVVQSSPR